MSIGLLSSFLVVFHSFIYWLSLRWNGKFPITLTILSVAVAFSFFMYVVGFRELTAGNDTIRYIITFINLDGVFTARDTGEDIFGNTEPLFWPIMAGVKVFADEPEVFIIITSFLSYILSLGAIYLICERLTLNQHHSQIAVFSMAILFSLYEIVYFGNHIRASLAVPLSIIAICLYEKNDHKYWLLLCLATSIHYSALVILLYPLLEICLKQKHGAKYLAGGVGFTFLFINQLVDAAIISTDEYVEGKANIYLNGGLETAIKSIYLMSSTWVILLIAISSILNAGIKKGKITLFFLILVLVTSYFPTISIRFFPFLLLSSVPGFVLFLINNFGVNKGVALVSLNVSLVTYIMFESETVIHTLGL
ncbi:MAG: EpsG family protein [Cycloclasticus sp.]|jgi:hypothetical protein